MNFTLPFWAILVWSRQLRAFAGKSRNKAERWLILRREIFPVRFRGEFSLSLFRVIQEALHNAIKYSGQKHFEVHLERKADEIELDVSDREAGFDIAGMKNGKGLGLVSMTEQIHLLSGRISIESRPNAGTKISACVPLLSEAKSIGMTAN
jgi:signal transduction histidine kinase